MWTNTERHKGKRAGLHTFETKTQISHWFSVKHMQHPAKQKLTDNSKNKIIDREREREIKVSLDLTEAVEFYYSLPTQ